MSEVAAQNLIEQKNKLTQELEAFSGLQEEIKQSKQEEIQEMFTSLSTSVASFLEKENNEEIKELQSELDQLKIHYGEILVSSKTATVWLTGEIERQKYSKNELVTYNLIEGTPLKVTMLSVLSHTDFEQYPDLKGKEAEKRLEIIFQKINIALARFYARKFDITAEQPLPEHLTKVIIPATERFLMDILRESGNETNVNFLGQISDISFDKIGELFEGVNNFAKKFTLPFTQGKALLNVSDFLALPKNRDQLSKLKNPYEFYEKVLKDPVWTKSFVSNSETIKDPESQIKMSDLSRDQFWLSDLQSEQTPEALQNALTAGQEKIKQELWSIQMVESPETVKKLLGVLDKADSFLTKTQILNNQLLDQMNWPWEAAKVLKRSLWIDIRKEIKKMPLLWGVLNFVLSLLGFSWWIDGLERSRKKRNIDRDLKQPQKDYISETYKNYVKEKNTDENSQKNVLDIYKLKVNENVASKFALDVPLLKWKISEKLEENPDLINLSTLSQVKTRTFRGDSFVEKVEENGQKKLKLKSSFSEEQREQFIDAYIQNMLEHFSKSKNSEALAALEDSDALAFSIISGVVVDKENLIDGIEAQVIFPNQFYEKEKSETDPNSKDHLPEGKKLKELTFSEASLFANKVFGSGPATELLLNLSEESPAMITRVIALAQHEWSLQFGRKNWDPNKNSGQINIGTFQISAKASQIINKWNTCLQKGKEMLKDRWISYKEEDFLNLSSYDQETADSPVKKAQVDLLVWLGFIARERGGDSTFSKLRNPDLEDTELINLISTTIQWWIDKIGKDVLAQVTDYTPERYQNLV